MALSSGLQKLLQQQNEKQSDSYQSVSLGNDEILTYQQSLQEMHAARGVLLEDGNSQVQVVVPADSLLDLQTLNQQLKRDLHAVPISEAAQLNEKLALNQISAVPAAMGLQTVVDRRLLDAGPIYLDSGCTGELIKTQGEILQKMAEQDLLVFDFAVPVVKQGLEAQQDESVSHEQDAKAIEQSVQSFTSKRILGRLQDTLELPPLPATAERILALLSDPDADVEDLTQVVEMDPSLAAQVVSWAQSPYYSAPGKINSIHEAIVRVLGYDLVMNLSLGLALSKSLTLPKERVEGNLSFWEQAVFGAALMEALCRAVPKKIRPNMGMCYLTGLLHNFGFLLLAEVFPPHFTTFCRYMEVNRHLSHNQIEEFLMQINREQMASWLMSVWGLPEEVYTAIRYQNDANYQGEHQILAKLLYVATRILRQNEKTDICLQQIPTALLEELFIDTDTLNDMAAAVFGKEEELQHMAKQFG